MCECLDRIQFIQSKFRRKVKNLTLRRGAELERYNIDQSE